MKLPDPTIVYIDHNGHSQHCYSAEEMLAYGEAITVKLQHAFWEACKPYGKPGECVYLTYKGKK